MKPKNRVHTATRWPADTLEMATLAKVDLGFVETMKAIDIDSPELRKIAKVARDRIDWAVSKLGKNKGKKPE